MDIGIPNPSDFLGKEVAGACAIGIGGRLAPASEAADCVEGRMGSAGLLISGGDVFPCVSVITGIPVCHPVPSPLIADASQATVAKNRVSTVWIFMVAIFSFNTGA